MQLYKHTEQLSKKRDRQAKLPFWPLHRAVEESVLLSHLLRQILQENKRIKFIPAYTFFLTQQTLGIAQTDHGSVALSWFITVWS